MALLNSGLSLTTHEADAELTKLHHDLDSRDMTRVLRALDYLLKNTDGQIPTCTDQYATLFEHRQDILFSLERLLDVVNPLAANEYPGVGAAEITGKEWSASVLLHQKRSWSDDFLGKPHALLRRIALTIDENYILNTILTILRNMSHEVANEVFVASSYTIMNHCVHIIMSITSTPHLSDASALALEILILVGRKIDLSGKRRLQWSATGEFLIGTGTTVKNAGLPLLYPRYKRYERQIGLTQEQYTRVVQNILPWCYWAVRQLNSRVIAYKATELVSRLAGSQENQYSFVRAPDGFFSSLFDLVCLNLTTAEPLVAVEPSNPDTLGRYRFPPSTCSNFFLDASDEIVRDTTLTAFLELCTNNFGTSQHLYLQDRLLQIPNFLATMQRIGTPTFPGVFDPRLGKLHAEGQSRALQIVGALQNRIYSQRPELFVHVGVGAMTSICHENPLQECLGERMFIMINKLCEGRAAEPIGL
jgi:hypothetical protein